MEEETVRVSCKSTRKTAVTAKNEFLLCLKDKKWITLLLKSLMPWRKGPFFLY
ncbi:MAG: DUF1698 domain-containing protein, partial [Arsenophonus sp. NC-CH8-MAG3]